MHATPAPSPDAQQLQAKPARYRHPMPFGTRFEPDGHVLFQLWAPDAPHVELLLNPGPHESRHPMHRDAAGRFSLRLPGLAAGATYAFCLETPQCGVLTVPDPASRYQPADVHGPSELIDPLAYPWRPDDWHGRPWHEGVIYELHVGTFTAEGTFRAAMTRLEALADLGVTAIELMPVADFPVRWNWGYDGVLPFAPDARYGRPEDLKALVEAAHAHGLMVLLDVVYNHFGPEGNYLHCYAPPFFSHRHHTPWGQAINFDGPDSATVRNFFIHNALYWLEEYRLDGLRLDAVHALLDDSQPHIIPELARAVAEGPGRTRHIHLLLENDANAAHLLRPTEGGAPCSAQWNDDCHHALHVLLTGEHDGYYADYAEAPAYWLARCLAEGFAWQGEPSPFRQGARRGEPSRDLSPLAFVHCLQNHDQIGNRALGERLTTLAPEDTLRAAMALLLLAPPPPMLFMGEEYGATTPFLYFCDFEPALAQAVREGRQR